MFLGGEDGGRGGNGGGGADSEVGRGGWKEAEVEDKATGSSRLEMPSSVGSLDP